MKFTNILVLSLLILAISCSSEPLGKRKTYSSVQLASIIDGLYRVDVTSLREMYCFDRNSNGHKFYTDSCEDENGLKIFANPKDLVRESKRLVEESCGGIAMQVGNDSTQKYVGNSQIYCSSSASFGTVRTNCNGGNPLYSHVLNVYFRCKKSPTPRISRDELFIQKMLAEEDVNEKKHDQHDQLNNHSGNQDLNIPEDSLAESSSLIDTQIKERADADEADFQKQFEN